MELRTDLQEDRNFIVVMAYDYQTMIKAEDRKFLWSTRFSVRSPGTNFEEAHYALSRAAAPFFGTHLEKLEHTRAPLRNTEVEIGEAQVVESNVRAPGLDTPERDQP
jgi:hypothetical protein